MEFFSFSFSDGFLPGYGRSQGSLRPGNGRRLSVQPMALHPRGGGGGWGGGGDLKLRVAINDGLEQRREEEEDRISGFGLMGF